MGNLPTTGKLFCERKEHSYDETWRLKDCNCMEHTISRWWYEITDGSYVVDVREVQGATGMAYYLGKYLTKANGQWDALYALGFGRRWARSANWPTGELRLAGSGEWDQVMWLPGNFFREVLEHWCEVGKTAEEMEKVGDDLSVWLSERANKRRAYRTIERAGRSLYGSRYSNEENLPADPHGRAR